MWTALLLSSWLCCLPAAAQACRCVPLTLAEYFERADVVLEAEVLAVEVVPADAHDAAHRRATIRVHADYGNAAGIAAVRTAIDTAQCGLDLRPGARYWIFGHLRPAEAEVWTNHCDGSRLVSEDFRDAPAKVVETRFAALTGQLDCPSPAPAEIARRIRLDAVDRLPIPDATVVSPNGAYRYRLQTPPTIARPPRVSTLIVDTEGAQYLRLSLHGAQSTAAAWINEKLIHLRVAWSGLLRTNLVLDVEHDRIVTAHHEQRTDEGEEWKPLADGCRRKNGPVTNE